MKRIKKFLTLLLVLSILVPLFGNSSFVSAQVSGRWYDLGGGWRFRIDGPHTDNSNAQWHVHVENKNEGSEGVNGKASHGDHMNKIPNKVKKKLRIIQKFACLLLFHLERVEVIF